MQATHDIAQSNAKDFADNPQTYFVAQIKYVDLGTRLKFGHTVTN